LASRAPLLAGALTVLLLAQAGVPFTTGFVAKLEVIRAAASAGSTDLAVVAMGSAAIAAFFYLRVVLLCFQPAGPKESEPGTAAEPSPVGALALAGAPGGSGGGAPGGGVLPATAPGTLGSTTALVSAEPVPQGEPISGQEPTPTVGARSDLGIREIPAGAATVIALSVFFTVFFGIWVEPVASFAAHATLLVRP
jgi:NADH:ubiquinone oxidoreductase subunit 2 (subunit N)